MYLQINGISSDHIGSETEAIFLGFIAQDKAKDRKDVKDKDGKDGKDGDNNLEPNVSHLLKERGLFCCHKVNIGNDLPNKDDFEKSLEIVVQP